MKTTKRLRSLMKKGVVLVPGIWNCLSAQMAERLGFEAVYMPGSTISVTYIGKPDYAYITQTEMLEMAERIARVVNVPLCVDIDDGFGNPLNVQRTIEICQKIGVAAVQMEDMIPPKRCANVGGGRLGSAEHMVKKIQAANDAKEDSDFIVIARTDNYEGIDELIRRGKMYAEAGADMLYPVGSLTKNDFKLIAEEVPLPLMDTPLGGGKSPILSLAESETYNIKLSVYSLDPFAVAYCSLRTFLKQLKTLGSNKNDVLPLELGIPAMEDFYHICDLERTEESADKYFN